MGNIPIPLIVLLGVALVFIVIEINSQKGKGKKKSKNNFEFIIFDIRKKPEEILDCFTFHSSSQDENRRVAFDELKKREIYQQNTDVKDLVTFEELGGETAGHEFDILPEALRRVRLEIRPYKK